MDRQDPPIGPRYSLTRGLIGLDNEKDAMLRCIDRMEVRCASWRMHSTGPASPVETQKGSFCRLAGWSTRSLSPLCFFFCKAISQSDQKSVVHTCQQIKDRQQSKKGRDRPLLINRNPPRGQSIINDNYCVNCIAGKKNCVHVTSKVDSLNVVPVIAGEKDCLLVTGKRKILYL